MGPGPGRPAILIQVASSVELEEGVLEDVFGQDRVAQVAAQVTAQVIGMAAKNLGEDLGPAGIPVTAE